MADAMTAGRAEPSLDANDFCLDQSVIIDLKCGTDGWWWWVLDTGIYEDRWNLPSGVCLKLVTR